MPDFHAAVDNSDRNAFALAGAVVIATIPDRFDIQILANRGRWPGLGRLTRAFQVPLAGIKRVGLGSWLVDRRCIRGGSRLGGGWGEGRSGRIRVVGTAAAAASGEQAQGEQRNDPV